MISEALELENTTNGAFDITVYPLMELWGFTTGDFAVPSTDKLQSALQLVGSGRIKLDKENSTITLDDGQGIDLGGIAKGFTSNRLMEIFSEYGLVSGMVSLGGNVQCYGTKPDGSLWKCGIINPLAPNDTTNLLGVVSVDNKAVITSGAYERYFEDVETGETYHHILNPQTGYPANNGLISVSVVSENGMLADALSTACYVMGLDETVRYWQQYGDDFDLILMTEDKEVYVTEPLAELFSSNFKTHIISK
jgi:thiamine biosynthesis lipoprotein